MRHRQYYFLVLVTISVIGLVIADGLPVRHQFVQGQPANAAHVNENFQELADRIADLPANRAYDYRNYFVASSITRKIFSDTNAASLCHVSPAIENDFSGTEIRNYEIIKTGDSFEIKVTREHKSATNILCGFRTFKYLASPSAYTLVEEKFFSVVEQVVYSDFTRTYLPGKVLRSSSMPFGVPMVPDGGYETTYPDVFPDEPPVYDNRMTTVLVVGLEDIEVPYGKFEQCLKLQIDGVNATNIRFSWYCDGLGEVKRMTGSVLNLRVQELISVE